MNIHNSPVGYKADPVWHAVLARHWLDAGPTVAIVALVAYIMRPSSTFIRDMGDSVDVDLAGVKSPHPSNHETFTQGWFNVGPPATMLAQHHINLTMRQRQRAWYLAIMDTARSRTRQFRCLTLLYYKYKANPMNTKHLYNIYTMLRQRRSRWADVVIMLFKCFVFTGRQLLLSVAFALQNTIMY